MSCRPSTLQCSRGLRATSPQHLHEVTLYTKHDCPLCHKAKAVPFELKEVDILKCDEETMHRYCFHIPVVHLNGSKTPYMYTLNPS
ncbi:glutaredoxin family domain, DUF836 protein [Acanthamoeba castellanii str. Neff]|uniref:Glutaredoxin-like protein n=1 Tax=Acanthamoeba castellanii (strain ATCC 30010 / Neff) TaxID=1257118 RepID=L8H9N9_ACACF|nr:glutaredoxin family domain, DUF836 protein [Acanthamoeba castellanii str. Neff]ELR21905.1 glutaredoxin family domain, DUF836 protein [Acanthamoeba castellanii str. Neff]